MNVESSLGLELRGALRASPRTILIAVILAFIVSGKYITLRFTLYYMFTELIAIMSKKVSHKLFPNSQWIKRPIDAGHCMGCGTIYKCCKDCIDASKQTGMPSGHSMTMMMTAVFWSMWIWRNSKESKLLKITKISTLILLATIIIISRTVLIENCHTLLQVTIGSVVGLLLGIAFFNIDIYIGNKFSK